MKRSLVTVTVFLLCIQACARSLHSQEKGVLIVRASKAHYYTFDINGAHESDARVQRFLNSVKFK